MTSSTSSSDAALAGRSLAVFAASLLAWNACLGLLRPEARAAQNLRDQNLQLAQDYLVEDRGDEVVMVGSSLSQRLSPDAMGPAFRSLSLSGGSAGTGVELVLRRERAPRLVLIEANAIPATDPEFVEAVAGAIPLSLARHVPSARSRYRPVNLLLALIARYPRGPVGGESQADPAVSRMMLERRRPTYERPVTDWRARRALAQLSEQVAALRARGVEVAFFVMPIHPELTPTPLVETTRSVYQSVFPTDRYAWIENPPGEYATTDGIHLTGQAGRAYAAWLSRELSARGL